MRYSLAVLISSAFLLVGCDAVGFQESGTTISIIIPHKTSWEIEKVGEGILYENLEENASLFLEHCKREDDECEVVLVATPNKPVPAGCDRWERQLREVDVAFDRRDHETWELEKPEPEEYGCQDN
jgi:hypothetical protein